MIQTQQKRDAVSGSTSALTRAAAFALVPFLVVAGVLLYAWPDRPADLFAWPITPSMTALLMGAGYLSGAFFFLRVATTSRWQTVRLGFLPIAAFAWMSAVTTLLHWGRFNHAHVTFVAWVALYAITPFAVPALGWLNRAASRVTPPEGPRLSRGVAYAVGAAGLGLAALGALLFVMPEQIIPFWPWALTPLTARTLGDWFVLAGLSDLSIAADRRWGSIRVVFETQLIGLALILIGILRAMNDLKWANPAAGALSAGLALLFVGLIAVYLARAFRMREPIRAREG